VGKGQPWQELRQVWAALSNKHKGQKLRTK
jgi:hypothetical protein